MNDDAAETSALAPLWTLTLTATVAATATWWAPSAGPVWLRRVLLLSGLLCLGWALARGRRAATVLWLIAGLAIIGGRGLEQQAGRLELDRLIHGDEPVAIRARVVIREGWAEGRWGRRARVGVRSATRAGADVPLPSRCRLEIRGSVDPLALPPPGSVVDAFAAIRGTPATPLLVASSPRLVKVVPTASVLLPRWRNGMAGRLLDAAGTDVDRIRAAELAATLALGRRDLVPSERRDGWRRSGLAHVLAVSGLHVGLVAGIVWFTLVIFGASPTATRVVLIALLPVYALLAGASPSAVRAAVMGMVYLGARLAGRALVPMAAVLLTVFVLLVADPGLVGDVSFQLTALITAALIRWAPTVTASLPGPRWLAAALAIPLVAQIAAAPLVASHFASAVPGAAAANIAVPWLLGPIVLASVAVTAIAPVSATLAGWLLDLIHLGEAGLWTVGAAGRALEIVPAGVPGPLLALIAVIGIAALLPGRSARAAAAAYLFVLIASVGWWRLIPPDREVVIELLPVSDGLAVRIGVGDSHLLMDGGSRFREAASALAGARVRRLGAVIASHGDSDHVAGLLLVLQTVATDRLVLPTWLRSRPEAVPLLRTARRRGVAIVPVARGSRIDLGDATVTILWPPAGNPPGSDNERSVVARVELDSGTALLTADIGRATELQLASSTDLAASVLVVPHHGSRLSASPALLDAVTPAVALIPAGSDNLHNHPHPTVLSRLEERGIPYRMPIRDGRCGARYRDGRWLPYPTSPCENH